MAASYVYVPYVSVEGRKASYQMGVDCSALACLAKGISRTWADNLHNTYLRPNTDNDCDPEDNDPDHKEPWKPFIARVVDGDMWYVDAGEGDPDTIVNHVGIYTIYRGGGVIHASSTRSRVERGVNPKRRPWWNGGLYERADPAYTIFRGSGTN